eukprot:373342_1
MTEFTINITARPLGVKFAHFDSQLVGIHEIQLNSIGSKLGLLPGDVLISINNESVLDIESTKILDLFRCETLPFTATFERFSDDYNSDTDTENEHDNAIMDYINSKSSKLPDHISANYNGFYDHERQCSLSIEFTDVDSPSLYKNNHLNTNIILPVADSVSYQLQSSTPDIQNIFSKADANGTGFVYMEDEIPCADSMEYSEIDMYTKHLTNGFIRNYIHGQSETETPAILVSKYLYNNTVVFDEKRFDNKAKTVTMVSETGFYYGVHEWSIKIHKTNDNLQEIGIISNDEFDGEIVDGITKTNGFGSRAIYGNDKQLGRNYYASYNDNGHVRINKDLTGKYWSDGDVVKVCLDLCNWRMRFYLNGQKVRKVISLQKYKVYFPVISYGENCNYELIEYK